MKKLFLSLTVLILFSINAKSENKQVSVSNFDVPANEQWMVDRVLSENPDLKAADLTRVEFEAGTYYGQVNSSGVPNGHGILGSADEEDSVGKGIESNFKNGKIDENEEPTIVSSTGETQTGAAAVEFQNLAFNNGFDVRVGLQSTLLDVFSNRDYIFDDLGELKSTISNSKYRNKLKELQDLYLAGNYEELISKKIEELVKEISNDISWAVEFEESEKNRRDFLIQRIHEMKGTQKIFNGSSTSLGDIFIRLMIGSYSDDALDEEIEDLEIYLKRIESELNEVRRELLELKDLELKFNNLLNFGFLQNPPTDNDEKLAAILLGVAKTDLKLDDIRFNINVNLRKDTTGGAIEGMINGKWYEIETVTVIGMSGTNIELQLTQKGKRDFDRDKKGEKGTDGSSEGEGEGGGMTYLIPNPKSQYLI